jgi:hypothetical protein
MTGFARAWERNAMLAPEDGSVAAFVRWYRALGFREKILQSDLYGAYQDICSLTGTKRVKEKHFSKHLTQAGYTPEQDDNRENGKRHRPMVVDLSRLPSLPLSLPHQKSMSAIAAKSGNRRARVETQTRIAA